MSILYFPGLQKYVCKVVNSENSDGEAIVYVLESGKTYEKCCEEKVEREEL